MNPFIPLKNSFALCLALLVMSMNSLPAQQDEQPEIIAHRGASAYAPENTLAAYRLAWKMGAPAAEVDVYLTKDNKVICLHDKDTERTTGVKLKPRETAYSELALLDAGKWKDWFYAGERIPLLSDLILAMPQDRHLYIEIKDNADIVPHITEIIQNSGRQDDITIIGFDYGVMKAMREAMPKIPIKWLIGSEKNEETDEYMPIEPANVQKAKEAGFDGLNVSYRGVTPELIKASKDAGFDLYVWTVNNPGFARQLAEMGISGITTDVPDVMLDEFGQNTSEP